MKDPEITGYYENVFVLMLIDYYYKIGRKSVVIVGIILSLTFMLTLNLLGMTILGATDPSLPMKMQLAFTKENFLQVVGNLSADERTFARNTLLLDFIYPLVYSTTLSSIIAILTIKTEEYPWKRHLIFFVLPYIAAIFDYIENIFQFVMLGDLNNITDSNVFLMSLAASIKWSLVAISFVIIIFYLLTKIKNRVTK